jgi:hypothetical protein
MSFQRKLESSGWGEGGLEHGLSGVESIIHEVMMMDVKIYTTPT